MTMGRELTLSRSSDATWRLVGCECEVSLPSSHVGGRTEARGRASAREQPQLFLFGAQLHWSVSVDSACCRVGSIGFVGEKRSVQCIELGAVLAGLELGGKALPIDLLDRIGSRGPIARDHKSRAAELAFRERAPHQLKPLLFVASGTIEEQTAGLSQWCGIWTTCTCSGRGVERRGEQRRGRTDGEAFEALRPNEENYAR
jgi:hypothetical protein